MWGSSGTIGAEFYYLVLLLFAAAALWVIGYVALVVPGRDNPSLCIRRFMHWFGCGGFLCGGLYGLFADNRYLVNGPMVGLVLGSGMGLFAGMVLWLGLRTADRETSS
jgi:hypothetical protein